MMKLKQTSLQVIEFGEEPEDHFYCLVDLKISPDGIDVNKLRLVDPRNFDAEFRDSGCILMLTGDEISSLVGRGDLEGGDKLHESLYTLAVEEGIIKKG
ncbi:MAG: hypothetical protein JJU46_07395 [Balneolaceae bacterium]|nr:hypothetical protein [Balneolaceae bacterium]